VIRVTCRGREVCLASQGSSAVVEGTSTGDVLLLYSAALEHLEWRTRMRIKSLALKVALELRVNQKVNQKS
jgi:hypothetical protein